MMNDDDVHDDHEDANIVIDYTATLVHCTLSSRLTLERLDASPSKGTMQPQHGIEEEMVIAIAFASFCFALYNWGLLLSKGDKVLGGYAR